jgi:membrane protease YdiL (CAAX protease family)
VLALLLELLSRVTRHSQVIAIVSALAWGAAHAYFHPLWFFGTVWSFYVFSRGYLAWRPISYKHALGAAAVPHALVNSSALLLQFFAKS